MMGKEPFFNKMKRFMDDFEGAFGGERRTETDSIDASDITELEVTTDEAEVEVQTHEGEMIDLKLETYEDGPMLETKELGQT
ncbi:MAG TPA: hypothetical protein VF199_11335, partial [Bacillales bacterium]